MEEEWRLLTGELFFTPNPITEPDLLVCELVDPPILERVRDLKLVGLSAEVDTVTSIAPQVGFPNASLVTEAVSLEVLIREATVDGTSVQYSVGGEQALTPFEINRLRAEGVSVAQRPTVLLLHGWGLGHHAYKPALVQLVAAGYHVVAPALPGFGGTVDLGAGRSFAGYAAWVGRFAHVLGLSNVILVGHSFGGGVAIRVAVDDPKLVGRLVLCNAVGAPWRRASSPEGTRVDSMSKRPLWSWGISIPSDMIAVLSNAKRVMPSVLEDLVPNVLRNPLTLTRVGSLARNADLRAELNELNRRNFPMTVAHSERDGVIPRSSFDCLCETAGVMGTVVPGNHSWPLTDPGTLVGVVNQALLDRSDQ